MSNAGGQAGSDLETMSQRGMRFVQRSGRGGGDTFVEAINLGSRGSSDRRSVGRGSVGLPGGEGSLHKSLSRITTGGGSRLRPASLAGGGGGEADGLTAAGRSGVPPSAWFESPPGHEMDGIGEVAAPPTAEPLPSQKPIGRGSMPHLATRSVDPGGSVPVFESPPGHENDNIYGVSSSAAMAAYTTASVSAKVMQKPSNRSLASASFGFPGGNAPLGRGSVGFAGGSGVIWRERLGSDAPLGRTSVRRGGMAPAALVALAAAAPSNSSVMRQQQHGYVFESPPGHELDGLAESFDAATEASQHPPALSESHSFGHHHLGKTPSFGHTSSFGHTPSIGHTSSFGRSPSMERPLGTRSVGFPGFGLVVESQQEAADLGRGMHPGGGHGHPLGRGSVGLKGPMPLARKSTDVSPLGRDSANVQGAALHGGDSLGHDSPGGRFPPQRTLGRKSTDAMGPLGRGSIGNTASAAAAAGTMRPLGRGLVKSGPESPHNSNPDLQSLAEDKVPYRCEERSNSMCPCNYHHLVNLLHLPPSTLPMLWRAQGRKHRDAAGSSRSPHGKRHNRRGQGVQR